MASVCVDGRSHTCMALQHRHEGLVNRMRASHKQSNGGQLNSSHEGRGVCTSACNMQSSIPDLLKPSVCAAPPTQKSASWALKR